MSTFKATIDPIVEEQPDPIIINTGIGGVTFGQTTIEVNGQNTINTTLEPIRLVL
ncbi:MAG: hypothetical protein Q9M50_01975 [Methylococcales bacterium]|nr:hypothetical protein [Methylococcales bacterium]